MCDRVDGKVDARMTPIGLLPYEHDLDLAGLSLPPEDLHALLDVDVGAWRVELADIEKHFAQFDDRLPDQLEQQLQELSRRLG
jgi:phosphoenolpyruvate carboxykinase (GTP)